MTDLVPAPDIERIVGARRHALAHLGRAVSAEQVVYILHSQQCKDSGIDLRSCSYSQALDRGINVDEWDQHQDRVVALQTVHGYLVPDDDGPDDIEPYPPSHAVDIAAVLAEHDWVTPRGYAWPTCTCGEEFPGGEEEAFAHTAAAVAEQVVAAVRGLGEPARRAVCLALPGSGELHRYAVETAIADAVLAVVATALGGER